MAATLTPNEQRPAWLPPNRYVPALGLAGACALAALTPLSDDDGLVLCPYRIMTGGWCPACGCTRALGAAVRGDLASAVSFNPLTLLLAAQMAAISAWFLAATDTASAWWKRNDWTVLRANLVIAVALWVGRLAVGEIPLPFS